MEHHKDTNRTITMDDFVSTDIDSMLTEEETGILDEIGQTLREELDPVFDGLKPMLAQLRVENPEHPIEFSVRTDGEGIRDGHRVKYVVEIAILAEE